MNKSLIVVLIVLAALSVGGYFYPHGVTTLGATANATNSTQKQLFIYGWNLANGTSTSVQNNTGSTVYPTELQYNCTTIGTSKTAYTGAGLAAITLTAATTSTTHVGDTPTSNTKVLNTNYLVNRTFATSTVTRVIASSTESSGATGVGLGYGIPNGAFITFSSNATNTAVCNIGVQVI